MDPNRYNKVLHLGCKNAECLFNDKGERCKRSVVMLNEFGICQSKKLKHTEAKGWLSRLLGR